MLVYRITLHQYSGKLVASGRTARWNPNDVNMIYAASSRSLACLENVVHRTQQGLMKNFDVMTIDCPDDLAIKMISKADLPENWTDYDRMEISQAIGKKWISDKETVILRVPSSIIDNEINYLLNPGHSDFERISLLRIEPFSFDTRIKD